MYLFRVKVVNDIEGSREKELVLVEEIGVSRTCRWEYYGTVCVIVLVIVVEL